MKKACTLDPMGSGVHSDDIIAVHHGATEPAYVCGYHYTYWPELITSSAR